MIHIACPPEDLLMYETAWWVTSVWESALVMWSAVTQRQRLSVERSQGGHEVTRISRVLQTRHRLLHPPRMHPRSLCKWTSYQNNNPWGCSNIFMKSLHIAIPVSCKSRYNGNIYFTAGSACGSQKSAFGRPTYTGLHTLMPLCEYRNYKWKRQHLIESMPSDLKSVPQKYLCTYIYQKLVINYFHYCLVLTCT